MKDNIYFSLCFQKKIQLILKKAILKNIYRVIIPKPLRNRFDYITDINQQKQTSKDFKKFIKFQLSSDLNRFNLTPLKTELLGKK